MAPREQTGVGAWGGAADPEADIEAPLISYSSSFFFEDVAGAGAGAGEDNSEDEEQQRNRRRFLLGGQLQSNTTSQVTLVSTDFCPIESLDYELVENDVFKQDWRSQGRGHILHYFALKWALCFLVRALTAAAAFVANLGVEHVVGAKFVVTSNWIFARRFELTFLVFLFSNLLLTMFTMVLTVYVAPAAAGFGNSEVKAYLNSVDAPNIFYFKTLVVKGREQRGEAVAAVPIRIPAARGRGIPLLSSGGGPR